MHRGGKIIGTAAMFSLAACGGEQGKLQIRPIGAPLATGTRAVPFRIAEARGQFALGNIGLALEAFRIALREDPNSIDAMTGVAACYDRMARFDLSRRNYEAALAIAPGDPQLLTAFAASLDLQGKATEAASVRLEVHQRIALAAQDAVPQPAALSVLEAVSPQPAALPSHPVVAPAGSAKPVRELVAMQPTLPPPAARPPTARPFTARSVALQPVQTAEVMPAPVARPRVAPVQVAPAPAAPAQVAPVQVAPVQVTRPKLAARLPAIGRSVTIVLPPARPVAEAPPVKPAVEAAVAVALPPAIPTVAPPAQPAVDSAVIIARAERDIARQNIRASAGPRLERLSLREVELITVSGPQWRALTVGRTQRSATVRFIPLRQAAARPAGVRLLNAARVDRLAARTRTYLSGRGWRAISIGDAPAVRLRSVIFYPADKRRMAERLSTQFGFAIVQRSGARQVTILLGRDAARASALRARA
jgi:hypothetical protein